MIVACSGIASPIRNSPLTPARNLLPAPRTIAYAAMNEIATAGRIVPDRDDHAVQEVPREVGLDDQLVVVRSSASEGSANGFWLKYALWSLKLVTTIQ